MEMPFGTGARKSPYDIRTFAYTPAGAARKGGKRYEPNDIEHQHKVGICTAISVTQNARKALGMPFSADFQYLCQKKYNDGEWGEGSSIFSALKVAKNIGLLPARYWTYSSEEDRKLPYSKYIAKLRAVPEREIERLKTLAAPYKIQAYAQIRPLTRDTLANAIDESEAGVLSRYEIGEEWWKPPIEPLRPPREIVSGHAVTDSNYDGDSFRIANTWGKNWANNGTAYRLHQQYRPTEAWIVYYSKPPVEIEEQVAARHTTVAKILDLLQMVIALLGKLK